MIVEELSKFIINLNYEDIPSSAIEKAKLCFLDFLGVANRGYQEESVQIAIKSLNEIFNFNFNINSINSNNSNNFNQNKYTKYNNKNNQNLSLIGKGYSNFDLINTAFINGISAHALDADDGHRFAQLHPGCVVFPPALAIAEAYNKNCKEFLEAVICGYEIAIILGKLANPDHRNQGFHSTGTIGTFAAGATAAKLLNLDLDQTIAALGLCGTQSSGLLESDHQGTMAKHLHVGKAVSNGISSAFLAKNGFSGAESILDGNEGFLKAMVSNFEERDNDYFKDYLNKELGKFHINEVYFKRYSFCRHLHSTIDAALELGQKLANNHININNIEEIMIETYKIATKHNNFNPKTKEDLRQSLPYAVAIAICYNDLSIDKIDNIDFNDNNIKNILNKISIKENEDFNKLNPNYRPSKVIVELANISSSDNNNNIDNNSNCNFTANESNNIFEELKYLPLGEAENPFSKNELLKKFKSLNPNFNINKLDLIDTIEDFKIKKFMNTLYL